MNDSKDKAVTAGTAALHERAEQNLQYIRALMESSQSFTGLSGKGYVIAGITATGAAWIAAGQSTPAAWLAVWMLELAVASLFAFTLTLNKAQRLGESLWSTTGKKLLLAFLPPMSAGAVFTLFLARQDATEWLPGIWLCLYGAAVMTAGAYSVSVIPLMGLLFLLLGTATLLLTLPGDLLLGLGMGGLHIGFGVLIWRYHGG